MTSRLTEPSLFDPLSPSSKGQSGVLQPPVSQPEPPRVATHDKHVVSNSLPSKKSKRVLWTHSQYPRFHTKIHFNIHHNYVPQTRRHIVFAPFLIIIIILLLLLSFFLPLKVCPTHFSATTEWKSMKLHRNVKNYEQMCRLLSEFSKWPPLPWKRPKC